MEQREIWSVERVGEGARAREWERERVSWRWRESGRESGNVKEKEPER